MPIAYGQVKGRKHNNVQPLPEDRPKRRCAFCHIVKPANEFPPDKPNGNASKICRTCSDLLMYGDE